MKFICTQSNLAQGISLVANASSTDSTLPILSNVLIKGKKGILTLTATNLEIGIQCVVGGRLEGDGETTVPAKLFSQYIHSIHDDKVEITIEKNTLTITSSSTESRMSGIDANEFPLIPEVKEGTNVSVSSDVFSEAVKHVSFAAATDNSRPEISGVAMLLEKNQLLLAATDGYRLAEYRSKVPLSVTKDRQVIVPTKAMNEIARIAEVLHTDISLTVGENQLMAQISDVVVSSRLIDGKYPDYSQIIPTQYGVKAVVDKDELLNAIKTCSVFSKTGVNDLILFFLPETSRIECAASSVEVGSGRSELAAEIKGDKTEIIFNHRYVMDGLNALSDAKVFFGVSGKGGPGVIKSPDREEYMYIVMPIKK